MDWITNAAIVAAVSNAGGLGVLGPNAGQRTVTTSAVETGERLRREIRAVRALTDKPFGVNLIAMKVDAEFPEDAFSDRCHQVVLCREMQASGRPARDITDFYHSRYLKGMLEGDIETGNLVCGAACAFVTRVQGAAEVVHELVESADQVLAGL